VRDREQDESIFENRVHDEVGMTLHLRATDLMCIDARPAWCSLWEQLDATDYTANGFFEIDTTALPLGFVEGDGARSSSRAAGRIRFPGAGVHLTNDPGMKSTLLR
jgi:hypothetical protein